MDKMISVIIPTYNRYEMLKQTIDSVYMQTHSQIEIIVIDDGSKDNTKYIKEEYPNIRLFRNDKNRGPGYNRKRGFQEAKGQFIIFVDDDDYYTDSKFFEKAIEIFEKNSELVFVAANAEIFHMDTNLLEKSELNIVGEFDSIKYLEGFLTKYKKPLSTFTCIFRKQMLEKAKFAEMKMVNDMPIYMRSLIGGKIYMMHDEVGVYRVHSENISKNISYQFLLENLEEKLYVYQNIKKNKLFNSYEEWWNIQIRETIGYWVYGSHPKLRYLNKMYRWCKKNTDDLEFITQIFKHYRIYLIDYKISSIKLKIKKRIWRKK